MPKEEFIRQVSELIAGLSVPVSLETPIGEQALMAWTALHSGLRGFGWARPEDYELAIRKVLQEGGPGTA